MDRAEAVALAVKVDPAEQVVLVILAEGNRLAQLVQLATNDRLKICILHISVGACEVSG